MQHACLPAQHCVCLHVACTELFGTPTEAQHGPQLAWNRADPQAVSDQFPLSLQATALEE